MGALALIALVAGGPLGMCLAIAYGVVAVTKIAKVDAQYAARGETPPGYRLIEKWLDGKKARGEVPADAKPARYGMWRYAWQRWQAMWELAAQQHRVEHEKLVKARAEAAANGEPLPKAPPAKEREKSGWQWVVDKIVAPWGEKKPNDPPTFSPKAPTGESRTACPDCGQTLKQVDGVWVHPSSAGCPKAAAGNSAATAGVPDPNSASAGKPAPKKGGCPRCGGPVSRDVANDLGLFCPACDRVPVPGYAEGNKDLERRTCSACGYRGRPVWAKPRTERNHLGAYTFGFIHDLTGTTACPTPEQRAAHGKRLDQIIPPGGAAVQANTALNEAMQANLARSLATPPRGWVYPNGFPGQAPRNDQPDNETAATEGDTMTTTVQPQQSGEVTGLMSAISYAEAVAAAHAAHSSGGGESYMAALGSAQVGSETVQSAGEAQQASAIAAGAWQAHAAKLREQLAAKEATTAETGSKDFLISE